MTGSRTIPVSVNTFRFPTSTEPPTIWTGSGRGLYSLKKNGNDVPPKDQERPQDFQTRDDSGHYDQDFPVGWHATAGDGSQIVPGEHYCSEAERDHHQKSDGRT